MMIGNKVRNVGMKFKKKKEFNINIERKIIILYSPPCRPEFSQNKLGFQAGFDPP